MNTCNRPGCDNLVEMSVKGQWKMYCSASCRGKHNSLKSREKSKKTSLEKYGVDNPFKLKSIRDSMKKTMIEKYGCEHTLESPELKAKRDNTMLEKYGETHALKVSEFLEKKDLTNIQKYGNKNIWNTELKDSFIDKKKKTNILLYGTEYPSQSDIVQDTRKLNTLRKYNKEHTSQIHITNEVLDILENKEWLENEYKEKSLIQLSSELGISHSHLHKKFVSHDIKIHRFNISEFEREVKDYLDSLSIDPCTSDRLILNGRELDLYSASYNIGIECNGIYWHSELNGKDKNYHLSKLTECQNLGIRLIHINDNDWINKNKIVKSRLSIIFGKAERKIYARDCQIEKINSQQEKEFLNLTHLQGYRPSKECYGLFFQGMLVSVMSFSKPRYSSKYEWELLRYSSDLFTVIVGGASKLFKFFLNNNSGPVISYSDISSNTGNVYKKLGFRYSHRSSPNYRYFL